MDRDLPNAVKMDRIRKTVFRVVIVVVAVVAVFSGFRMLIKPSVSRSEIRTAIADRGDMVATVTGTGVVQPEFEQELTSPFASRVMDVLLREGQPVKSGQSIVTLDRTTAENQLKALQDEYELIQNRKRRTRLLQQQVLIDLESRVDIMKLKIQSYAFKLEQSQALYDFGQVSREKLNEDVLNLEIARREMAKLEQDMQNQRDMLESDLAGLDLEISIKEQRIDAVSRELEQAAAVADRDGVVTFVNDRIGSAVNPGDVVARIANLDSFRVEGTISDIHLAHVEVGTRALVRIREGVELPGSVRQVQPTVENGIVTFTVELDDSRYRDLRPNLRVDVYLVTSFREGVVRVKNGPFYIARGDATAFVIKGDEAKARDVRFGVSNFDYVEILSGIEPGEEVIISNTESFRGQSKLAVYN